MPEKTCCGSAAAERAVAVAALAGTQACNMSLAVAVACLQKKISSAPPSPCDSAWTAFSCTLSWGRTADGRWAQQRPVEATDCCVSWEAALFCGAASLLQRCPCLCVAALSLAHSAAPPPPLFLCCNASSTSFSLPRLTLVPPGNEALPGQNKRIYAHGRRVPFRGGWRRGGCRLARRGPKHRGGMAVTPSISKFPLLPSSAVL